jgi:hypothetical protein
MWAYTRHALAFFQDNLPFTEMLARNDLISTSNGYCFARLGETYAVYLKNGGTTSLDLDSSTLSYDVQWYNPRTGGPLVAGTVTVITGPGPQNIGLPPSQTSQDWVALIATEVDSDGDGVPNHSDAFPFNPNETVDTDGDGLGDNFEQLIIDANGGDAIDTFNDVLTDDDFDGDGVSNYIEFLLGFDPTDGATPSVPAGRAAGLILLQGMVGALFVWRVKNRRRFSSN